MATALFHTLGSIQLPRGMVWVDEFDWSATAKTLEYSTTGSLLVDVGTRQAGRSITLQAEDDAGWRGMTRSKLQAVADLRDTDPAAEHLLTLADGRSFTVIFADEDAIEARPVARPELPTADHPYVVTLRLTEV